MGCGTVTENNTTPTYVSSAYSIVDLKQTPAPLIIGERLNVTGSLKTKKLVLDDDYDGLIDLAREQVEQDGVHCLDVCIDTNDRSDEEQFMVKLVKKLGQSIKVPLVIDSTNPDIIISAIKVIPGKPIINSINLENDQSKFDKLAPIMEQYGLPAVAMCIGESGIAKTVPEKVALAKQMFERGQKYNLKQSQFIFDVCVLPLGTPETTEAGKNTLEAIKEIKKIFPDCYTILGISNISFGFKAIPQARKVLNSVFLYHAVKYGLDAAIVNAKNIIPYSEINEHERKITEDIIFNTSSDAVDIFSNYFLERKDVIDGTTPTKKDVIDPSWSAGKRVNFKIIHRFKENIKQDVIHAIYDNVKKTDNIVLKLDDPKPENSVTHESALHVLNKYLLPAMKTVGDKFASGELILPFVLKSAECMKLAVDTLEQYLEKTDDTSKGKIVLGTVAGDVHDIGKNLVKTIFTNNGYTVYDLGNQVPIQKFVDKIKEVGADAVGLSALLVVTTRQMKLFAEYAQEHNLDIPIICGGAIVDSNYINRVAKNTEYKPGIWYCNDMFEGLNIIDTLQSDKREQFLDDRNKFIKTWKDKQYAKPTNNDIQKPDLGDAVPVTIPENKQNKTFYLDSKQIDVEKVWTFMNKNELFKAQWGLKGKIGKKHEQEHEELYEKWKKRVIEEKLFEPKIVYGYYKCHGGVNDSLLVDNPHDNSTISFDFPRSTTSKHHCLSDYFAKDDIVAFQVTTSGTGITDIINKWNDQGEYTDAFYLNGLAVIFTEALADYINGVIKEELNITKGGLRYSWGYPACPDISQQHLVWKLLQPEKYGLTLTDVGQIIPEQSTAAIVTHHPEAKYFPK